MAGLVSIIQHFLATQDNFEKPAKSRDYLLSEVTQPAAARVGLHE